MTIVEKKMTNAIIFFALKSNRKRIGRLKLMKLLWLADRIHLNKYGRLILRDQYSALPLGPVPSTTMNKSKDRVEGCFDVEEPFIVATGDFDPRFFSKTDIKVMDGVWEEYGKMGGLDLKDFSHLFPEWKRFEEELKDPQMPNSYPIVIEDLFDPPVVETKYVFLPDESKAAMSTFLSHRSIQNMLSE
jgi:uncharacterized phage-associated protein